MSTGPINAQAGGGLNFDNSTSKLAEKSAQMEQDLQVLLSDADPSNMKDMLMIQQQLSKTTMTQTLQSSVIKSLKDTTQGIMQKIN